MMSWHSSAGEGWLLLGDMLSKGQMREGQMREGQKL
jgi:hypothetical protein